MGSSSVLVPRIGKPHVATFRKRLESLGNFFFFFFFFLVNTLIIAVALSVNLGIYYS